MARKLYPSLPADYVEKSIFWWNQLNKNKQNTYGLSRDVFVACDGIKRAWRHAHPNVVQYWADLNNTAINAINNPGHVYNSVRKLKMQYHKGWLRIKLPSGRYLCYPNARIEDDQITYSGINQYSRKWGRIRTYGGKLFENLCQAVARDVLAYGMKVAELAGYAVVSSVHDELITEVDDTETFSASELSLLMATNPPWAKGLPLAAAGFESHRYRKD